MEIIGRKLQYPHISLDIYWTDEEQEAYSQEQNKKLGERKRGRFGQDDSKKKQKKESLGTTTNID